jgi:acyl carrier protein
MPPLRGRKDLVVKIRGYTVDAPKVETALLEHPRLKQAAVVARQNSRGDAELIAYIVPTNRPGPNPGQLRRLLKQTLPEHMIPAIYVELDALPLTSTGKIDRNGLPEPGRSRPSLDVPYVACRNATERQLIKIWEEVLDTSPVGVFDNFFDLGGQSLSSTRIAYRVFRDFQLKIPMHDLLLSPTVAEMATLVANHRGEPFDSEQLHESLSDEDAIEMVKAGQRRPSGK